MFPLTELLKTKTKFIRSSECQLAFENVKSVLCSSPVLAAPRFDRADHRYHPAGMVMSYCYILLCL